MGIKLSDSDHFSPGAQTSLGEELSNARQNGPDGRTAAPPGTLGAVLLVLGANSAQHLLSQLLPRKTETHREPGLDHLKEALFIGAAFLGTNHAEARSCLQVEFWCFKVLPQSRFESLASHFKSVSVFQKAKQGRENVAGLKNKACSILTPLLCQENV